MAVADNVEEPLAVKTGPASRVHLLSDLGVAITIFKGNCGCIILYMPRAWANGGWLFSSCMMPLFALVAVVCCNRLVKCKLNGASGSYGDVMAKAMGPVGRRIAETSVVSLQAGVCCTYYITCAQLLKDTILPHLSVNILIALCILVWGPLCLIRKMSKLWACSVVGSVLVMLGAGIVFAMEGHDLHVEKPDLQDLSPFNPSRAIIFCGTAIFAFEGIGLVSPTFDAAKNPERFSLIFGLVFACMSLLLVAMGFVGYVTFGDSVAPLVLLELPNGVSSNAIKLAFAFNIFFSFPMQAFPIFEAIEPKFFEPMSNPPTQRKVKKHGFRVMVVALLALVAIVGATNLDNFVSLVGGLCGLPLAFIYPCVCHLKLVVGSEAKFMARLPDYLLMSLGCVLTLVISVVNILTWSSD